uniref:CCHC-type domain-containing protein n=1 Tax=Quercus lobata TaxID=97700 RepID=A0A7N2LAP6_QUELO
MSRTCSQCGNNGHNSRTCTEARGGGCGDGGGGGGNVSGKNGIMSFGVRVTEGNSFRKSARVPWTEEEHRLFLLGLQKLMGSLMEEEQVHQEIAPLPKPQPYLSHNLGGFPVSTFPVSISAVSHVGESQVENLSFMRTTRDLAFVTEALSSILAFVTEALSSILGRAAATVATGEALFGFSGHVRQL